VKAEPYPALARRHQSPCPTEGYGGAADQILPGCRDKWKDFQDQWDGGPVLNLYGSDVGSGVYDARMDPRSWDVTRDGDPDFAGFDATKGIGPSNADHVHPAVVFRSEKRAGNEHWSEHTPVCTYAEYRPADQTDELEEPGLGLPQCSRFERDEQGFVADGQVVYPKGVGHPFTGQPWRSEIAALSWNLMTLLVFASAEFESLWVPEPNEEYLFPLTHREPLAFATFDPNDPDNAERIAQIELIQNTQPDTPETRAQVRLLRAAMKPICSFITPAHCGKIRELLSYTARVAGGDPESGAELRVWLWETGGEYQVSEARGDLTGNATGSNNDRVEVCSVDRRCGVSIIGGIRRLRDRSAPSGVGLKQGDRMVHACVG
jgi:hypothetical protein